MAEEWEPLTVERVGEMLQLIKKDLLQDETEVQNQKDQEKAKMLATKLELAKMEKELAPRKRADSPPPGPSKAPEEEKSPKRTKAGGTTLPTGALDGIR
eukprot:1433695-Lingulodinium_polyedra.AAC.1